MRRHLKDYTIVFIKGLAMGVADAIPGVSGGTIAFISGIYEELVSTISNINPLLFKVLIKKGPRHFWKAANGNFIIALVSGIAVSYISFMKLAKVLLETQPVMVWSFFFGLIVASIFFVGSEITKWNVSVMVALLIGSVLAYFITTHPPFTSSETPLFLFLAGAVAICAMILPGISGSFILIVLGAYKTLSIAIQDVDLKKLLPFLGGAVLGLLSFSHFLKWLFKRHRNETLALLTGFIFGSLNKVWPWKKTLMWHTTLKGVKIPLLQENVSPFSFHGNGQTIASITLMGLGIAVVLILEKIGSKSKR